MDIIYIYIYVYIYIYIYIHKYVCIYILFKGKNNKHFCENISATAFINLCFGYVFVIWSPMV